MAPAFFDMSRADEMETETRQSRDDDVIVPLIDGKDMGGRWRWRGPLAIILAMFSWDDKQRR